MTVIAEQPQVPGEKPQVPGGLCEMASLCSKTVEWRKIVSRIFNIVIGTAGHIDHGKSSLVRVLTGINPDRLKEEIQRGITIDLGFAPLVLPDGKEVGIVDVPGHEKFIKNMVAGATGIDFVVLVIAADDGVMQQTREHLEIMEFLGIRSGMVALTKIDLVEADLRLLAQEEIAEFLQGTFLQDAPIVPVSTTTGEGTDSFMETLFQELKKVSPRSSQGIFRMPIQRVFSKHGYGTIVTGIPVSGSISIGDSIEVLPGRRLGRVRKIQAYGKEVEKARAGHSTALNIKELESHSVKRGDVVSMPGYFESSHFVEAKFTYLKKFKAPLEHMTSIRFHTGTLESLGKISVLGKERMDPGESGYVQIRLEEQVVAAPGDHFVVRMESPMITIGGGVIISVGEKKLKRFRAKTVEILRDREGAMDNPSAKIETALKGAGYSMVKEPDLQKSLQMENEKFKPLIESLVQREVVIKVNGSPARYVHEETLQEIASQCILAMNRYFSANPHKIYARKIDIKNELQIENMLFDFLLDRLAEENLVRAKSSFLFLPGRSISFTQEEQQTLSEIENAFLDHFFTPPAFSELEGIIHRPSERIASLFEYLCETEALVQIEKDLFFHAQAIEKAKTLIVEAIQSQGELVSADFRDRLQTSRKYIIPLLEYFDKVGLTVRRGNSRILKK